MPKRNPLSSRDDRRSAGRTNPGVVLCLVTALLLATAQAADIIRGGPAAPGGSGQTANAAAAAPAGNPTGVPDVARPNAQARLTAARDAVAAVRAMQSAAANLSRQAVTNQASGSGAWNLGRDNRGKNVVVTSGLSTNGLLPEGGAIKDPSSPTGPTVTFVVPGSWKGVGGMTQTTTTAVPAQNFGNASTSVVDVTQTQQQAILNWDKFNIAPDTKLNFDQTLGGADVRNWIAFNKVGVTGSPSQILGSLKTLGPKDAAGNHTTGGQVYVINPNGIIFGGTSQVNAHAIVASSLPINDHLIARGLLNNPDSQFHFSGLSLSAGANTEAFTPLLSETIAPTAAKGGDVFTSAVKVAEPGNVVVTYPGSSSGANVLVSGDDYGVEKSSTTGKATVTFTPEGLAKVAGSPVKLSYTPSADTYGDVVVQGGAQLISPTSAERVGGRIALIGPNVTNVGTLTAPDGQVVLAAGLQVGMAAHSFDSIQTAVAQAQAPANTGPSTSDPTLRGLDFYVGKVTFPEAPRGYSAGTATNAREVSSDNVVTAGLIQTTDLFRKNADGSPAGPVDVPGSVLMTGKTVNQMGVINSLTTVSFNGRVDLLANYNAVSNPSFNSTNSSSRPFDFESADSAGIVTLGAGSLIQIMPSESLTEKVNSTADLGLTLRSQVNLQGRAIHLASNVSDSADAVPADALAATIRAPNAEVNFLAGSWHLFARGQPNQRSQFYYSGGQVYLDRGTLVDVSGTQAASASVTENIVAVQLRGPELADSPLQRDGALRGQTVQVDLRVHGPWDPTKNDGRGGYAWIGTPLGDASGYVNLVQRTAGQLTASGGTVNLFAGGSVVVRDGAKIDVSGGWIDYAGGRIQTTKVIHGGHLYDISQATPERIYQGIFDGSTTTIDPKWGVVEKSTNQTLLGYDDPGYTYGGNGGKVSLVAPSVALDGSFLGQTQSGQRQVLLRPEAGALGIVAKPSEFRLLFQGQYLFGTPPADPVVNAFSPTPANVTFQTRAGTTADGSLSPFKEDSTGAYALPKPRQDDVELSPDLINRAGFGFVSVDASDDNLGKNGRRNNAGDFGRIVVPLNPSDPRRPLLTFEASAGSYDYYRQQGLTSASASLELLGANIDIFGGVVAPSGRLNFIANNVSSSLAAAIGAAREGLLPLTAPLVGRGSLTLGARAGLNVAGQVVDFRDPSTSLTTPLATLGGKITLRGYQTDIAEGSTIDVSGGVMVSDTGRLSWGAAGELEIGGVNEQQFFGAILVLPKTYRGVANTPFALRGFSGTTGGQLSISAPLIQVGGDAATDGSLVLDPLLFGQGGFTRYSVTGAADGSPSSSAPALWLGAPTEVTNRVTGVTTSTPTNLRIAPEPLSYRADLSRTGQGILQTFLPEAPFRAPVRLNFQAKGSTVGTDLILGAVVVEKGVSISLTPNANSRVSLSGDTVSFFGKITAPGGEVSISGGRTTTSFPGSVPTGPDAGPLSTVYLGPTSEISTAGAPLVSQDPRGNTVGAVLPGGKITIAGNIVAAKGSRLDASGATGEVDVSPFQIVRENIPDTSAPGPTLIRTTIDSDGGKIELVGGEMLFSDATLLAKAGGAAGRDSTALGGTLTVDSGIFIRSGTSGVNDARIPSLVLVGSGATIPVPFPSGTSAVGLLVKDADGNVILSSIGPDGTTTYFGGTLAASSFRDGGFEWLGFGGSVKYTGNVSLKAGSGIQIGYKGQGTPGGVLLADSSVASSLTLSAPYVALGLAFATPGNAATNVDPSFGIGTLSVTGARLIDVGNLSLQGIGTADLKTVAGGDIRGNGTLEMVGALNLTAGQIYPPSAVAFTLIASDHTPAEGPSEPGSITINRNGTPSHVPLSAGGQLNVYASNITQSGVLRAPVGQINLGQDGTTAPLIPGKTLPVTEEIILSSGSVTSVSALDLATGKPLSLPIPYGNNLNGTSWIDPTGTDITVDDPAGRLVKKVTLFAAEIDDQASSSIDVAGGGDLFTYRWVRGVNGSTDILRAEANSFAVIPDYKATYAPFGAFNDQATAQQNLSGDAGYTSIDPLTKIPRLKPGDSIFLDLDPADSVGAQNYTLLPARYALLPGAYLVTPKSTVPSGTIKQADGSTLVAGYRFNALNSARVINPLYSMWEVAPGQIAAGSPPPDPAAPPRVDVVRLRAQYDGYLANSFFADVARQRNALAPRLPLDGGQLVFAPRETISLEGKVNAQPLLGADGKPAKKADGSQAGRGGIVDIGSPLDILIAGPNTDLSDVEDHLVLDTNQLNAFGAESLLIGGIRTSGTDGTTVAVTTDNVLVDNGPSLSTTGQVVKAGASLSGSDIVLAANRLVAVLPGSSVVQSGALPGGAETLTVTGTVKLQPSETVFFAQAGLPISFPDGTGDSANGFTASVDGFVTSADGTTKTNFKAGEVIKDMNVGSTFTLVDTSAAPGTPLSITLADTSGPIALRSGDGALLRVSSDPNAQIARSAVTLATYEPTGLFADAEVTSAQLGAPSTVVFGDATVSGGTGSLILDSTGKTDLRAGAKFGGKAVSLNSRSVSLAFDNSAGTTGSLLLRGADLEQVQKNGTTSLSLLSYSSIDLYGSGTVGGAGLEHLVLHTPQFIGKNGGSVTFQANDILLNNPTGGTPGAIASAKPAGNLVFNATALRGQPGVIHLGSEDSAGFVRMDLFDSVRLSAESAVVFAGSGGLNALGSGLAENATTRLTIDAPLITAMAGARQSVVAGGAIALSSPDKAASQRLEGGLGATLTFRGASVKADNRIWLPSGTLSLTATTGDVSVGGTLDVAGQAKTFVDLVRYTPGGQIKLTSDQGRVEVRDRGILDVSAALDVAKNDGRSRVGDAGAIMISASDRAAGRFVTSGTLRGWGGSTASQDAGYTPGRSGSFALDVGSIPDLNAGGEGEANPSLEPLNADLNSGGFLQERSIRVRHGDVIVDGLATSHIFNLSADEGNITVTGKIDASGSQGGTLNLAGQASDAFGNRGGKISLAAHRSVILDAGSELTVAAADFDAAGKGGAVVIEAGSSVNGVAPSTSALRDADGRYDPTQVSVIDIRGASGNLAAAKIDLAVGTTDVALSRGVAYVVPLQIPTENVLSSDVAGSIRYADGSTQPFEAGTLPPLPAGSVVTLNADGNLRLAGGTLHLRAPQTTVAAGSAPDVQINPVQGSIRGASSIVIEGYKTYEPLGGFIDTVASQIDADGQVFASSANAAKIRTQLGLDSPLAHVRPGAEIVSPQPGETATQIAFTAPGATSRLDVSLGGTVVVLPPTDLTAPISTYALRFSSTVTLTPVDAGEYTAPFSSTAPLTVLADTTVTAPATIPMGRLTSSVAGTITLTNGTQISFAKDQALPQVPSGARLTFSGPGKLSSTANVSFRVSFRAGQSVALPANSLVMLSTKGGSVTFDRAGTLTWDTTSPVKTGLALQLPNAGSYTTGNAITSLLVGNSGWTSLRLNSPANSVDIGADTTVALPQGLGAGSLTLQSSEPAEGGMKVTLLSTRDTALTLNAGDKITATRGASLENPDITQLSASDVDPLSFSSLGGRVIFNSGATVTITGNARLEGVGSTDLLPIGTSVTIPTGASLVFSGAGSVKVVPPSLPSDPAQAAVRVRNNLPAGQNTLAAGGTVFLANAPDRVELELTGAIQVAGAGAISFTSNVGSKFQLAQGSGATLAVAGGKTVSARGATVVTQATTHDLTLAANLDLSTFRYGEKAQASSVTGFATFGHGEPGVLTVRAKSNLIFNGADGNSKASLSDGFLPSPSGSSTSLWQARLLPAGSQSWSYRLVAGSDLQAADFRSMLPLDSLAPSTGSVQIGLGATAIPGSTTSRVDRVPLYYQTIRTGTGDISIVSGRDVQLLNSLATIYTAGTQVANPTSLLQTGDFDLPNLRYIGRFATGQQLDFSDPYPAQYSYGGGNVTISAQNDITHLIAGSKPGELMADSSREMPTNWLYRRGYVDPVNSEFGTVFTTPDNQQNITRETASTAWWIDFSNFFQGVGALGGGNVALSAGGNVANVDAVVPTNARMTKQTPTGSKLAVQQTLVELGGGDLNIKAGAKIDASVYYVERGKGSLHAGDRITTNAGRTTLSQVDQANFSAGAVPDRVTWLPTTLFLGKGSFEVAAGGDILLGSVANPFLLPQGVNNSYYQRTYFSTASPSNSLRIQSLQGDVTFKAGVSAAAPSSERGTLFSWYAQHLSSSREGYAGGPQPWLRLAEPGGPLLPNRSFNAATNVLPGFVEANAFAGDINLVNDLTLAPSSTGSLNLLAAKSVVGLSPVSLTTINAPYNAASNPYNWSSSIINLSDADPRSIPNPSSPRGVFTEVKSTIPAFSEIDAALSVFASLFRESGSTTGENVVLQTQQALHGQNSDPAASADRRALHGSDTEPMRLYAATGDISGLSLFSGKAARISAGRDITDIGLYLQNARSDSTSVISAGRDLIAYNPNSLLQLAARSPGNSVSATSVQNGDLQISGPGALAVFAGRNIDLGAPIDRTGVASDGTGVGISSIGNTRNPHLPFQGADIIVGAGFGGIGGLQSSLLNFADPIYHSGFIDRFLDPAIGGDLASDHLPQLGVLLGFTIDPKKPKEQNAKIWETFNDPAKVSADRKTALALEVFYKVLRDAGRDHNNPERPGFGNFNDGYAAIATLFNGGFDFSTFITKFITTSDSTRSGRYVPELGKLIPGQSGASNQAVLDVFTKTLSSAERNRLAAQIFALALRDAEPADSTVAGAFTAKDVIETLYPTDPTKNSNLWKGDIALSSREIRTTNGGNISLFAPGGGLSLGRTLESKASLTPPGIITQFGGNVSIFTDRSVEVGVSRIFTLRGGDVTIWSTTGDIAAGSSSKTIQSAPPTRVLFDPQSASVKTDLAGLATGGGIGVLATVDGVRAGDVDLIAPVGTVDAGDAGIRVTGNLNIAAFQVINAGNIQVGGTATGTPPPPAPPNVGGITSAATAGAATTTAATDAVKQQGTGGQKTELPSLITVEVLGYGGGEGDDALPELNNDEDEEERKRRENRVENVQPDPGAGSRSAT